MKPYVIMVITSVLVIAALVIHLATKDTIEEKKLAFIQECDKLFGNNNSRLECSKTKCVCIPINCLVRMNIGYDECQNYLKQVGE